MPTLPESPAPKALDAALVWLRRDLRAEDHAALHHALAAARRVWCAFVYDRDILDPLLDAGRTADRRVEFIHDSLAALDRDLQAAAAAAGAPPGAGRLLVRHGAGADEIVALARELRVQAVYASHDDEPASLARDARVRGRLADAGIALHTSKDHVVFERSEVLTANDTPYTLFTPYRTAWLKKVDEADLAPRAVAPLAAALAAPPAAAAGALPTLAALGFERTNLAELGLAGGSAAAEALFDDFLTRIDGYDKAREYPAVKGMSYLSVHLRFGTVSVRRLAREAKARADAGSRGAAVWLSELIWRDFFHQLLHHRPYSAESACRPEYDAVKFEHGRRADELYATWSEARTGYPLVDAAMAQLHRTGYMHNRLRMVAATFLVKDLGIDWRRGERHFALHLNDYDLAANVGNWQWAASTGCDAQPWFRIFNPLTQSRRFDPQGRFIRRYLPQLAGLSDELIHAPWLASPVELAAARLELGRDYPPPVVDHEAARQRSLERYAVVREARKDGAKAPRRG